MSIKVNRVLFPIAMAASMVYGMEVYNAALRGGAFRFENLLIPAWELAVLIPVVIALQTCIAGPIAARITASLGKYCENAFVRVNVIRPVATVLVMCPLMSCVAAILFKDFFADPFGIFLATFLCNFPMALCWQLLVVGPLLRRVFLAPIPALENRDIRR